MVRILVVGAGISGCAAAYTLACGGFEVILVEKADCIGGRVRSYGCKAIDRCQNCGVCLTAGLWDKVTKHQNIRILTNSVVKDIKGEPGDFTVSVESGQAEQQFDYIGAVIISTGFDYQPTVFSAHLHINCTDGIMTGSALEELMLKRTRTDLFDYTPKSVAFIQCLGSRDKNEGGLYCSRVCCSYSTRAAKMIRKYYPQCEIVFFYMELQNVESGDFYAGLRELGVEFIKCRPSKISGGKPVSVEYDDPVKIKRDGPCLTREFDLVILSDGIHASADSDKIAEVCKLGIDKDGFLRSVGDSSGIYVCGCARAPMKIDEAYADAVAVAGKVPGKEVTNQ